VCLVWPGYAGCDAVGYAGTLDATALTPCAHLFEVRATDADGNARVIAARRVFVDG
jgi:energy-converting hydrogenase Eha subunit B